MRPHFSERFIRSYTSAPPAIQRAFDRKLDLLLQNLRHPSLRAKKYDEARDLWQARVNEGWRFYFRIQRDIYELIDITAHPK
jgi:mRNA interferase RelE/StbE